MCFLVTLCLPISNVRIQLKVKTLFILQIILPDKIVLVCQILAGISNMASLGDHFIAFVIYGSS